MTACAQRMKTCAQRISSVLGLRGTRARRVLNLCIVWGAFFGTHIDVRKINLTIFIFLDPQIIIAEYKWDTSIMPPRKSARKTAGKERPPKQSTSLQQPRRYHREKHPPQRKVPPESFLYRKHSLRMVFYVKNLSPRKFFYIEIHPQGIILYRENFPPEIETFPRNIFYIEFLLPKSRKQCGF